MITKLILIGVLTGIFSGLFGIGGGIILVPLLLNWLKLGYLRSVGISIGTIVLSSTAGFITYSLYGLVYFDIGFNIAIGMIAGSYFGNKIIKKVNTAYLPYIFVTFQAVIIIELFMDRGIPANDFSLSIKNIISLFIIGIVTGIASRLFGVGGGIIIVPALILIFDIRDLEAKGTSLFAIVPGSLVGAYNAYKNKQLHIQKSITIGAFAVLGSVIGQNIAMIVPMKYANILFAIFLLFISIQTIFSTYKKNKNI